MFFICIASSRVLSRIQSWAFVYYPLLEERRRRYIELKKGSIDFRKPATEGSVAFKRDAFFNIDQIAQIRPIVDKTAPSDEQFTLQLICVPGAVVHLVNVKDEIIGTNEVEILELCFPKQFYLNSWRSVLLSPYHVEKTVPSRAVQDATMDSSSVATNMMSPASSKIGIFNVVNNKP
jgi:hypothetical protein